MHTHENGPETKENAAHTASPGDTRKPRRLASVLTILLLIGAALLAGQWLPATHAPKAPALNARLPLNDPAQLAPDLEKRAAAGVVDLQFTTLDGKRVTLGSFIGRPTILNFWASWCAPCIKEMPALDALAERYEARGLRVVVASLNATPAEAGAWLAEHHLTHLLPVMDPGGRQLTQLGQGALPLTLLIREDGTLAARMDGYRKWDSPEMREVVEGLVKR